VHSSTFYTKRKRRGKVVTEARIVRG